MWLKLTLLGKPDKKTGESPELRAFRSPMPMKDPGDWWKHVEIHRMKDVWGVRIEVIESPMKVVNCNFTGKDEDGRV